MGELSELQGQTQGETLEAVYEKFNIDHLADYKGHCSCDSPSFVRVSRTASARFCFMSCIIIHLLSSLQYTSSGMNYSRIQILYGVEYMIKRRKREKDRYYILKTKSNMTYCTYCGVLQ